LNDLGSVKTAEEFDSLPPEEAKRRLKMLLTKMDRNKDGQIERKELHSWILRSFRLKILTFQSNVPPKIYDNTILICNS